jgi:hypothetical protein
MPEHGATEDIGQRLSRKPGGLVAGRDDAVACWECCHFEILSDQGSSKRKMRLHNQKIPNNKSQKSNKSQ